MRPRGPKTSFCTRRSEVDLGGGVANHVKWIGDEFGVGKDRGENAAVGGGEIERARSHVTEPLLATLTKQC